ncbi:hypothetical protein Hanom_Chr07g00589831 [Helianthus anomalus]
MDKNKPLGIGETQFHAVISRGLQPVGPAYKVVSVEKKPCFVKAHYKEKRIT